MKVYREKEMDIPNGFYCKECFYKQAEEELRDKDTCWCTEFYGYLNSDSEGRSIKQEECLLTVREALASR